MCNPQNREAAAELPNEAEIQRPFELQFTDSWCRLPPMTLPFPRADCIVPAPASLQRRQCRRAQTQCNRTLPT